MPEAEDVMSDGVSRSVIFACLRLARTFKLNRHSHPNDFPCVISCRDAHVQALVLESVLDED